MHVDELPSISDDAAIGVARECVYRFLSAALADPTMPVWNRVLEPQNQDLAVQAGDILRAAVVDQPPALACGELAPVHLDLAPLVVELSRSFDQVKVDYERVFGLVVPKECPPYETEYHPPAQAFMRAQQMADIAGFYRAFGIEPSHSRPERPDHVALELEFMAFVLTKRRLAFGPEGEGAGAAEQVAVCDDAQRTFFRDHLAWWLPSFATGLGRKAGGGFYAAVAHVLAALLPVERARFGVQPRRLPLQPSLIERPEEQTSCVGCSSGN